MRLITIIGTDGSGKTTLSDMFAESLTSQGIAAERVWLGAESQLMKPVRAVLRRSWRSSGAGSAPQSSEAAMPTYSHEISRKNQLVQRFPHLVKGYVSLAWADYRVQTAAKFAKSRDLEVLIADRYLFDVAVNIGLTLGWTPDDVVSFCQVRLATMPLPQARFFLRVTPDVSMSRKDDIPDASYLELRLSYYDAIAAAFGFEVLDGTKPLAENLERLHRSTMAELRKPYVHYVHANNSDVGGADRVLASMARHAASPAAQSPAVRVSVSLREATAAVRMHSSAGTPVFRRNFVRPQTSGGPLGVVRTVVSTPSSLVYFLRLFGRERPDVVHVNDLYDVVPATAARLRGIPVVYHIRMIKTDPKMRGAFSRLIPRLSSASASVSGAVREHYFGAGGDTSHRALVIHDLGNEDLIRASDGVRPPRPAPLPDTGLLVLMIGRVEPWKGQHVFLEAIAGLDPDVRAAHTFALVGGHVPGHEQYFAAIEETAKVSGAHFLGERADVPDLLRAADISVHCSVDPDPFPGVVVESMLASTYTIGADAGGVRELITSSDMGRLTRPGSAEDLARALSDALESEFPRDSAGAAARRHALGLVSPESVDPQLACLYSLLAPAPHSALEPAIEQELR